MTTEDEIINNIELPNFDKNKDFFGFEASKRKVFIIQEEKRISNLESKTKYVKNRVFVNNGDSYHGKYIILKINQEPYKDTENINSDHEFTGHKKSDNELNEIRMQNTTSIISDKVKVNLVSADSHSKKNKVLDKQIKNSSDNCTTAIKFKSVINTEPESISNIRELTVGVSKQNTEPKKYDIVTTVKNKLQIDHECFKYLKHLNKIIIPNNKHILMKEIRKCAIVVYDITLDKNQINEAYAALHEIIEEINFIKNHPKGEVAKKNGIRVFILISSLQTWALTTKKNFSNKDGIPITQDDYKHRCCHPNFQAHYNLENYILQLNDQYCGLFSGIVLASGLVYGQGENVLKYIYKSAFSDTEILLIPKHDNSLPIIHVENLAKIVKNLVEHYDKIIKPYIVGIETSRFSLRNITEVIRNEVQKKNYEYCNYSSLFLNPRVNQTVYDMVTMSIQIFPVIDDYITQFISLDESIPQIFTETIQILAEYRNLRMKNMIINGPYEVVNFARKLAQTYHLNFINPISISEEFLNNLEANTGNIDSFIWLESYINDRSTNQTIKIPTTMNNIGNIISLDTESSSKNRENKQNNFSILDTKELLTEQKKYFEDKGLISDEYLLPIIKNKLHKSKWSKCGYIISNFPETIEQAQNIFNLEHFTSQSENNLQISKDDINPSIIIDVIMVGKNMIKKVTHNTATEQLKTDICSKPLCDKGLEKLHDWFSLDSKYTEDEIMKHITENELEMINLLSTYKQLIIFCLHIFSDIKIRKNRKVVDYLEVLIKPKMYQEHILISQNNFMITHEEFDRLLHSLLISMPVKIKANEAAKTEISHIKAMINQTYDTHQGTVFNTIFEKDKEIETKHPTQLLKKKKIKEESVSLENSVITNFIIKCVNPIIVNGIMEVITNQSIDPIDDLVEYIYNHNNMYNPCISSPLKKKTKVANFVNSLNRHLS